MHSEPLEPRRLLSVSLNNGVLSITGTDDSEQFVVEIDPGNATQLRVSDDGSIQTFARSAVQFIRLNAASGDDTVRLGTAEAPLTLPATLYGGSGNDTITAFTANGTRIRVYGQEGDNAITLGGNSRDIVYAGEGNNIVNTGSGRDYIIGGEGNDYIDAGPGMDRVFGLSGNDQIFGGRDGAPGTPARDYLDGGEGNDSLFGGNGNDTLIGDEGDDWLYGGSERDDIRGGAGSDRLFGEAGNDTLRGQDASDQITGGADIDFFLADELDDEVLDFQTGIDRILAS
jgi:Ca2+-binding RTX toxin-like protein